jgi:glucose-6-phosphate isomerase
MGTLKVIAKRILAFEVANANGGAKNKAYVIVDIGGMGLGPNMVCEVNETEVWYRHAKL